MEFLQSIFGEGADLAAIASGAGLFGGGAGAALALFVSGTIARFFLRAIFTAVLTGGGFLFLLNYLGFQIVPPENFQERFPFGQSLDAPGLQDEAGKTEAEEKNSCKISFRRLN